MWTQWWHSIAVFFVVWVCRKNSSHEIKSKQNRAIDGVHRLFFYQSVGSLSISITSVWSTFSIRAFAIATIDQCDHVRLFETLMFFSKTIFSGCRKMSNHLDEDVVCKRDFLMLFFGFLLLFLWSIIFKLFCEQIFVSLLLFFCHSARCALTFRYFFLSLLTRIQLIFARSKERNRRKH